MADFRIDGLQLVVRIFLDQHCFMHPVSTDYTYVMLSEEICRRHKIRTKEISSLVYFTPGSVECLLQTEADFRMMLFASKTYDLKQLDINVRMKQEQRNKCFNKHSFNLNLHAEEDEYLATPYKSIATKSFLSDEWGFYITGVGQKFYGGKTEFRDKLKKYAIQKGFCYYYTRNDHFYISVQCEDMDCCFFIKGSVFSVNNCFYIDQCELMHSCNYVLRKSTHNRLDVDIVAESVLKDVMYNPNIRPKDIIVKFKLNYGFDIGYKVALNARYKAMEKIYGKDIDSFTKLIWYTDVVKKTNPSSYVDVEVEQTTNRFKRVFIVYGGCVAGFNHCVPVVYVDGCFGKSMYKGQILAATSKDGHKGIFPLAICVCDSETEENWSYFFNHMKKIFDAQPRLITFISDRGVGLLGAFDRVFPSNPHLYCYCHLQNNLKSKYTGKGSAVKAETARDCFFKCAYSSTEKEFYRNLNELREKGGPDIIDNFCKDLPLEHWCLAFVVGCRFGIMANTIVESFNSWISVERSMPVYSMLEEVRLKQMKLLNDRRIESDLWHYSITPNMQIQLEEEIDKGRRFKVIMSHEGLYEVRDVYSYVVDLNSLACSCMKWQINSFPCPHALSAIMSSKLDVYKYIHLVYTVPTFRKCYENPIKPVPNLDQSLFVHEVIYVQPPLVKIQAGRPRKRRFRSVGEASSKKPIVCGRCHKKGNHNRSTCGAEFSSYFISCL